ncbi:MAG: hypothetical protein A2928_01245 [Candidatus Taylorbacteria bacterium RIFCSPLOWO2_01_FULL_45_15b]|uniref:Protein-L-isoaspartate O-methyltransferase n=1 Tax=Candidatus Taylorbacteria bacterium RIFCSPLOWO2_01_FULL_45_15b TaxID=1802319 RepID=A0A1G2NBV3_9BACT|nr:MAG: hypothetical protein A2928_01245 [Candidatus Taylorbacteria bacterium RIFCSPLOWO2_01_FULL_45_15b]
MLDNPEIERVFSLVNRADFVHPDYEFEAYEDYPLPIADGESMLQPTTAAFILELLGTEIGDLVLQIGTGTGWMTTLLSYLAGHEGFVYGTEIRPELKAESLANVEKYDRANIGIEDATNDWGLPKSGPYNRILVTSAVEEIPRELLDQLAVGGVLVVPVSGVLTRIQKVNEVDIDMAEYPGFSFEPLLTE